MSDNGRCEKLAKSELKTHSTDPHNWRRGFTARLRNGTLAIFRAVNEHLFVTSRSEPESHRRPLVRGASRTTITTTITTTIVTIRAETTTTTLATTITATTTTVTTPNSVTNDITISAMTYSKSTIPSAMTEKTTTTKSTTITTITDITDVIPNPRTTTVVTKSNTCTRTF